MVAQNLREAYKLTGPDPLMPGDPRYVDRVQSTRQIVTFLQLHLSSGELPKLIVTGARGTGKTTELLRISEFLSREGTTVLFVKVSEFLDLMNLRLEDIILLVAQQLLSFAYESHLSINKNLVEGFISWFRPLLADEVEAEASLGLPSVLATLATRLVGQLKFQSRSEEVRVTIRPRVSELVSLLNAILDDFIEESKKSIVFIFDDLDRLDLANAYTVFHDNASFLTQLHCGAIFTSPISLLYSPTMPAIQALYEGWFTIPATKVALADGRLYAEGIGILREMVLRRMSPELIVPEALDMAIHFSGGLPRDLLRLVNAGLLAALSSGAERIGPDSMQRAVTNFARDFQRIITQSEILRLKRIRETKQIQSQDDASFIAYSVVIEHQNGDTWWDVHPVVQRAVLER